MPDESAIRKIIRAQNESKNFTATPENNVPGEPPLAKPTTSAAVPLRPRPAEPKPFVVKE